MEEGILGEEEREGEGGRKRQMDEAKDEGEGGCKVRLVGGEVLMNGMGGCSPSFWFWLRCAEGVHAVES